MPDQNQFWESLDKYRYILDSLPNPVIVTDMDKIVRYINVAARAIVPPPYEKLLNQPAVIFIHPTVIQKIAVSNASCVMKRVPSKAVPEIL